MRDPQGTNWVGISLLGEFFRVPPYERFITVG